MTQIGIIMGSNSDWTVMQHAAAVLKQFGIAYETRVVSAHRTPDLMFEYAETAREHDLILPVPFPDQRGGRIPWPPGEDAGKGEVPVPEPAPADAYCQHEHEVRGAQALVQFSGTSFR